jgi:hypothetical protein
MMVKEQQVSKVCCQHSALAKPGSNCCSMCCQQRLYCNTIGVMVMEQQVSKVCCQHSTMIARL